MKMILIREKKKNLICFSWIQNTSFFKSKLEVAYVQEIKNMVNVKKKKQKQKKNFF